jgi:hypothetical protein
MLGVTRFTVIRWEAGEHVPAPEQRERLAHVLGGVADDYIRGEDEEITDEQLAQEFGLNGSGGTAAETLEDEVQTLRQQLETLKAAHNQRLEMLETSLRVLAELVLNLTGGQHAEAHPKLRRSPSSRTSAPESHDVDRLMRRLAEQIDSAST